MRNNYHTMRPIYTHLVLQLLTRRSGDRSGNQAIVARPLAPRGDVYCLVRL